MLIDFGLSSPLPVCLVVCPSVCLSDCFYGFSSLLLILPSAVPCLNRRKSSRIVVQFIYVNIVYHGTFGIVNEKYIIYIVRFKCIINSFVTLCFMRKTRSQITLMMLNYSTHIEIYIYG